MGRRANWKILNMKKSLKISITLSLLIALASFMTFFYKYNYPDLPFWDENYYIATAQRYLNGIFFLHEHPPLGHMLIAAGEKFLHGNLRFDQFINVEKVDKFPPGFSFKGYRLMPTICAWLTPVVFFHVLKLLTKSYYISFLLTFLYLLDNALIVHSRGAMLDAPLMFFICLTLLFFLLTLHKRKNNLNLKLYSLLLGVSFALVATTKYPGGILMLVFPALYWKLFPHWKKIVVSFGFSLTGFLVVFLSVWQLHFLLGSSVNPALKRQGYFTQNVVYQEIIAKKHHLSPLYLPKMLHAVFDYTAEVNKAIPDLNLCKPDENGSPAFFWPLGARSINYRWETQDSGQSYRYLYLQVNPVVWFLALFGVIGTTSLLLIAFFFPLKEPIQNRYLMTVFLSLYLGFMIAISQLNRVVYLYHYFPALLFSFCLFALWVKEVKHLGQWILNRRIKLIALSVIIAFVIISYCFYSPLTYYQPITDDQFRQRMIFSLWDLRCVKCEKTGFFKS